MSLDSYLPSVGNIPYARVTYLGGYTLPPWRGMGQAVSSGILFPNSLTCSLFAIRGIWCNFISHLAAQDPAKSGDVDNGDRSISKRTREKVAVSTRSSKLGSHTPSPLSKDQGGMRRGKQGWDRRSSLGDWAVGGEETVQPGDTCPLSCCSRWFLIQSL